MTVGTGSARRERLLRRRAEYAVTRSRDTVVVQALELELTQLAEDEVLQVDTDGFVGGRWRLVSDPRGDLRVVARPFVPPALLELNDPAAIMDDFFPAVPPPLSVGDSLPDGTGRLWWRLPDSAAVLRFGWHAAGRHVVPRVVADSLTLQVEEERTEDGSGAWDGLGAVTWRRALRTRTHAIVAGVEVVADLTEERIVRRVTP
ncbi:MAG: hypothetical protein KC544_00875 [Gemmatimonadetes bacterium]|nr:hypothetical protein [Gemmatimonadota bacterium]MCA9768318.1 hypothetical protein [Gemmatimonadota bacterium]MCB9505429.1 hypothetical protein [Gemmatimonadales bacterium]MCB9518703.1 hypothetical protein [Gemmatimonadales bacterium]